MGFTRGELEGARLHWLLTLRLRGRAYRFSTDPVSVTNANDSAVPTDLYFEDGLTDPGVISQAAEIGDLSLSAADVPLDVLFVGRNANGWQAIAADDQDLGDSTAELSLIREAPDGTVDDWSQRDVIASGFIDEPEWGAASEPVTFTLRAAPTQDRGVFPPVEATVSSATWPRSSSSGVSLPDNTIGETYPWIFGEPGRLRGDEEVAEFRGSPALMVEVDTTTRDNNSVGAVSAICLIAGHRTAAAQTAANVTLYNVTQGTSADFTPTHTQDELGRTVTIITVTKAASGGLDVAESDELWVSWKTVNRGGLVAPKGLQSNIQDDDFGARSVRGMGEVINALLGYSTVPYQFDHLLNFILRANAYNVDWYVNAPCTPSDLIMDALLPALPAAARMESGGLSFVWFDLDVGADAAIYHVRADLGLAERVGRVRRSSAYDIANDIRMEYALDGSTNKPTRIARVAPKQDSIAGTDVSILARASHSRYQGPAGQTLQAELDTPEWCQELATASAIVQEHMLRRASTRLEMEYLVPQEAQFLKAGDVVLITDDEIGLSERVAHVTDCTRGPSAQTLTVFLLQQWIRDAQP